MKKFEMGQLVGTPGAMKALEENNHTPFYFIFRHLAGDFGIMPDGDVAIQNRALLSEGDLDMQERMMSAYELRDGTKIWIITEADRSVTTFLLPEEY